MNFPTHPHSMVHHDDAQLPRILILHGPNLNLLGMREPTVYGSVSLEEMNQNLIQQGHEQGFLVETFQSNHEGQLIDRIQQAFSENVQGMVINAGGYSHTSVALRDTVSAVLIPTVEVHLSNLYEREEFRHKSLLSTVCIGVIMGFRMQSYLLGLTALIQYLRSQKIKEDPRSQST